MDRIIDTMDCMPKGIRSYTEERKEAELFIRHLEAMRGDDKKFDHGKVMWDLLPIEEVEDIAKILTHGAEKYGAYSWKEVKDARNRYFAAAMRHLAAWKKGEVTDPDSGLPHLAHAGCNLLFLSYLDKHGE